MNLNKYLFLIFTAILWTSYSQEGGRYVYQFINLSSSARQVALGGEALTILDDVNQAIWNPSVINSDMNNKLSLNYVNYIAGIKLGSVSYAKTLSDKFGTLHGNIKYLNYGTIIGADEEGNENGTFRARDLAVSVGYAIDLPLKYFYMGMNLRIINSSISTFSSTGISTDIAFLYNNPVKPYAISLVLRNIGTQIQSFDTRREKLPFKMELGGSYKLEHVPIKWFFTIDNLQQWDISPTNPANSTKDANGNITEEKNSFVSNMFKHFVIGSELFYDKSFNLRLGYNFRRANELSLNNARTMSGLSFGFGLKKSKFQFDYAFSRYYTATNASTFSLTMYLDKISE